MKTWLQPTDKDAFLGMEKLESPSVGPSTTTTTSTTSTWFPAECPKCRGYGGWHLELNAYGPGRHFDCACSQCNGCGYVEKGSLDEICVHEWTEIGEEEARARGLMHWGMFCHVHVCRKCVRTRTTDSSG